MLSVISASLALQLAYPVGACSVDTRVSNITIDTGSFFGTAHWPDTPEKKAKMIPRLKQYGIRLIRNDMGLEAILDEKRCRSVSYYISHSKDPKFVETWNWDHAKWVKEAKDAGFRTMAIFTYFPKFLTANGSLPAKDHREGWEIWQDICGIGAKRLDRWIDYYEVFNEAHFFAKAEHTGFKRSVEADPYIFYYGEKGIRPFTSKPIGGTATWIDCWAGSALETLPYDPRISRNTLRFASIHIYDTPTKTFLEKLDKARAILDGTAKETPSSYDKRLKGTPLWLSEWDFYWGDKQVNQEWYGYILTELIKRGINNCIYDYEETFSQAAPELQKPWLLLVKCGLNERSQKVRIHAVTGSSQDDQFNSTAVTLPDGSVVLLAANLSGAAKSSHWSLSGWKGMAQGRLFVSAGSGGEIEEQLQTSPVDPHNLVLEVPPQSFIALRLNQVKRGR